jgi:hypothetical protein
MTSDRSHDLKTLKQLLLRERTWRYLRYVHLREGVLLASGARSMLSVGAGKGYAELALALEHPDLQVHVTDVVSERTPNYQVAQGLARKLAVPNISFGTLDILDPPTSRWDLVVSVELLEHLEDDATAAAHMLQLAHGHVFALVPFAHATEIADPRHQRRVWEKAAHVRVGYDAKGLAGLFPRTVEMRGCYWQDAGLGLRKELQVLDDHEINQRSRELIERAREDIRPLIPRTLSDALGIWTLAHAT